MKKIKFLFLCLLTGFIVNAQSEPIGVSNECVVSNSSGHLESTIKKTDVQVSSSFYNTLDHNCYDANDYTAAQVGEFYSHAYNMQKQCHFISDDDSGVYFVGLDACCRWICYDIIGW